MRLKIEYTNQNPVEYNIKTKENIYEIHTPSPMVTSKYLKDFSYLFGLLLNKTTEEISKITVEDLPFAKSIVKNNLENTINGDGYDPEKTLICDMAYDTIVENRYLTYFTSEENLGISLTKVNGILNTYNIPIKVEYNKETKELEYKEHGKTIEIDDIEGENWLFIALLNILLLRGKEQDQGVFYINCFELSKELSQALIFLIKTVYKQKKIIFLYNIDGMKLGNKLELPNIK